MSCCPIKSAPLPRSSYFSKRVPLISNSSPHDLRPLGMLWRIHRLAKLHGYTIFSTAEQAAIMGKRNNPGVVDLPVGVSVFPNDLPAAQSWAPLVYPKLFYWRELDRGGRCAQMEVPELFTEELRRCFRSFRNA